MLRRAPSSWFSSLSSKMFARRPNKPHRKDQLQGRPSLEALESREMLDASGLLSAGRTAFLGGVDQYLTDVENMLNGTVLVTGGGSGIGRATAQRAAQDGAAVAIVDSAAENAAETAELVNDAVAQFLACH